MFVKVNALRQKALYPQLQRKTPSAMAGFSLSETNLPQNRSGPTRLTVRPLMVRTTGGNRTRDLWLSQSIALSTELQRYTERKIGVFADRNMSF